MAKKRNAANTFSIQKHVRIYDLKVAQNIERILEFSHPRYKDYNSIIVEGLKFGLPKILEEVDPETTISDIVKKESDRIIQHSNKLYAKLSADIMKVLVTTVFTQEITTVILNEVETLLKNTGFDVSEEQRRAFMENIPNVLNEELTSLLEKHGSKFT